MEELECLEARRLRNRQSVFMKVMPFLIRLVFNTVVMPTASIWNFIRAHRRHENEHGKFRVRLVEVVNETWYLGLTAFGGPPVHFQIFHKKFVEHKEGRDPWLDEQTVR